MKKLVFFSTLLILGHISKAQFLLGQYTFDHMEQTPDEDSALNQIGNLKEPKFKMPTDSLYMMVPAYYVKKTESSDLTKIGIPWSTVAKWRLASFLDEIRLYSDSTRTDSSVACAYGVFGLGNYGEILSNAFSEDAKVRQTFYTIYKTPATQQQIYNWVKPFIKSTWLGMRKRFKDVYKSMLNYVISYLQTFDYAKEKAYLDKCKKKGEEWKFCSFDRNGKSSPFRKGSAWCYRRIASGQMSAVYILSWCQKIKTEILTAK